MTREEWKVKAQEAVNRVADELHEHGSLGHFTSHERQLVQSLLALVGPMGPTPPWKTGQGAGGNSGHGAG